MIEKTHPAGVIATGNPVRYLLQKVGPGFIPELFRQGKRYKNEPQSVLVGEIQHLVEYGEFLAAKTILVAAFPTHPTGNSRGVVQYVGLPDWVVRNVGGQAFRKLVAGRAPGRPNDSVKPIDPVGNAARLYNSGSSDEFVGELSRDWVFFGVE
jgi:hypothetical protein